MALAATRRMITQRFSMLGRPSNACRLKSGSHVVEPYGKSAKDDATTVSRSSIASSASQKRGAGWSLAFRDRNAQCLADKQNCEGHKLTISTATGHSGNRFLGILSRRRSSSKNTILHRVSWRIWSRISRLLSNPTARRTNKSPQADMK